LLFSKKYLHKKKKNKKKKEIWPIKNWLTIYGGESDYNW
jgi:hypothetical protein